MAKNDIMLEEWRKLHEAALQVKKYTPWEWMEEVDVFGVENPEDGTIGFVSIMGALGEFEGISVYLGVEALDGFWEMQNAGPDVSPEMVLELPQLQISFTSRKEMEKQDLALIKKLGLKPRGKNAWPQFRSIIPAHLPWFLEDAEVRFLRLVMEQILDVLKRCEEEPEILEPPEDDSYLIRVPRKDDGGNLVWEDEMRQLPPPEDFDVDVRLDAKLMETFKALPQNHSGIECALFMVPAPVMEKDRPFFPYVLLMVDPMSTMVLGIETLQPSPSLAAMRATVPNLLLEQCIKVKIRPQEIAVDSDLMYDLLEDLADEAGVELIDDFELEGILEVKASMFEQMAGLSPDDLL